MTESAFKRGMAAVWAICALMGATSATAQQTIRVGWTIPAEESKYWMMKRPAEFPELGKTYNIEWVQFQGTAPMTQALAAGALDCATQSPLALAQGAINGNLRAYIVAQHVFEKPGGFSVYWAVKDDSPIKTIADLKGKTMSINTLGSGIYGPMAVLLRQNGVNPDKDIKLVEIGFSLSEDALRSGRVERPARLCNRQGGPLHEVGRVAGPVACAVPGAHDRERLVVVHGRRRIGGVQQAVDVGDDQTLCREPRNECVDRTLLKRRVATLDERAQQ